MNELSATCRLAQAGMVAKVGLSYPDSQKKNANRMRQQVDFIAESVTLRIEFARRVSWFPGEYFHE